MADVVNLNPIRKAKAKFKAAKKATDNRARFGRTKAEKSKAAEDQNLLDRHLDGKKISKNTKD